MKTCNYFISCLAMLLSMSEVFSQLPIPAYSVSRTTTCPGFGVNFTDQSTNAVTYVWIFEGGNPAMSFSQNPTGIIYGAPGKYDVTLTVTNANGSVPLTNTDQINVVECKASEGIYRVPYDDGTQVKVNNDHLSHRPSPIRVDMVGTGGTAPYRIVAAADGWIRMIMDNFSGCCNGVSGCSACNNYVWIEHPNGEWTKYTHFVTNSVTDSAQLVINQFVCAGRFLGLEGDVGASSGGGRAAVACSGNIQQQNDIDSVNAAITDSIRCGIHLHFEVGVPSDPSDPFDTVGGFLNGQNRIPIVCGISGNYLAKDSVYTANPCDDDACDANLLLENQSFGLTDIALFQADNEITAQNNFSVNSGSNVILSADNKVTLKPGFRALANSYFQARTGNCNESEGTLCNVNFKTTLIESGVFRADGETVYGTTLVTYPNPFDNTVSIIYMLGDAAHVKLNVFNAMGAKVIVLVDGTFQKKGTVHKLVLDATNIPGGIYHCVLETGKTVKVTRLVKIN